MTWDPQSVQVGRAYGTTWRTSDECLFLDRLGQHRDDNHDLRASEKIQLLHHYLESMDLRAIWRNLDREVIRRHATKLINSYEAMSQRKEA